MKLSGRIFGITTKKGLDGSRSYKIGRIPLAAFRGRSTSTVFAARVKSDFSREITFFPRDSKAIFPRNKIFPRDSKAIFTLTHANECLNLLAKKQQLKRGKHFLFQFPREKKQFFRAKKTI
jgi:hypothetical protein